MNLAFRYRAGQRPAIAFAAVLLAFRLGGDRADGFSYFQVGGQNVIWSGAQSVRYLSPTTFPPGSVTELHYLAGMGLWNLAPKSNFEYFYSTNPQDFPIDNFDGFSDTIAVPAAELGPGVLGATYLVNDGRWWYDMDQLYADLPDNVGWHFEANPDCATTTNPSVHGYSFLLVATHELGHSLGLGHDPTGGESPGTPFLVQMMNPRYPSGGTMGQENIIELHAEDGAGVRFLYPVSGPSGPAHVDLANAGYSWSGTHIGRAIPVFFSPAQVYPGEELVLRSVIENLGTVNHFNVRFGYYLSSDAVIEPSDLLIADVRFDLAFEDAQDFDAAVDMPADLAAGQYYVGSIFDDLSEVSEVYEDNNAVLYCSTLTVRRRAPVINDIGQSVTPCGVPYTGPTPTVTLPLNMAPLTWSIDNPQPGMTINPATGVVSWPSPVRSEFPYTVILRATNSAGSDTEILFVGVTAAVPQVAAIGAQTAVCGIPYDGPTPQITQPACMAPIVNWSLDAGPAGMTIDHDTGEVFWPNPTRAGSPHTVTIRATNAEGNGTRSFSVEVVGAADRDNDGDVDPADYELINLCHTGPEVFAAGACECSDLDGDGDVDLRDLALFLLEYSGERFGACCQAGGTCNLQAPLDCALGGGTYLGDNTSCPVGGCTGACCLSNGFCLNLTEFNCNGAAGTFHGAGTNCATTICTP